MKYNKKITPVVVASTVLGGLIAVATVSSANAAGTATVGANSVDSSSVVDHSLTWQDIAPNSIGPGEVANLSGADIVDRSLTWQDIAPNSIGPGEVTNLGADDLTPEAQKSLSGFSGAVYRSLTYLNGGGGSATVACADDNTVSQKYVAIAGGVQGSTVDTQSTDGFAVTSSFPGRMDWDTNAPKPNRLDGWIILGNNVHTTDLTVWALCVPTTSIEVQHSTIEN
ncbi:hypothetical protein [Cellulomonas sp. P5_E12]